MGRGAQETQGGDEVVGRFPGSGVIVSEYPERPGERVLAEPPRCLDLAHR